MSLEEAIGYVAADELIEASFVFLSFSNEEFMQKFYFWFYLCEDWEVGQMEMNISFFYEFEVFPIHVSFKFFSPGYRKIDTHLVMLDFWND